MSAWFTPNGDLLFEVAHHADRSVKVVFPRLWSISTGVVEVEAFNDASDSDKTATRWELRPLLGTADVAHILKRSETGKVAHYQFDGAPMSFELTLTKK